MNAQRQTNTFTGGMMKDMDYSLMKSNQYVHAENIRVVANEGSSFGVAQNIEGVIKTHPSMPIAGETIIHTDVIRDWAIVFTKTIGEELFSIYRYDFTHSDIEPNVVKIVDQIALEIKPYDTGVYTISSVCVWESETNVKMYWADGFNSLRVLNIDPDHDIQNQTITAEELSILPQGILPSLTLDGYGSGNLAAGKYQYAYQLFNPRGSETAMSSLSETILTSKDGIGSAKGEPTGKSIKLRVTLPETTVFSRAKVIRVYYKDNTSVPVINIINDVTVIGGVVIYEDRGGEFTSSLTIDEFNSMLGYDFIPKVLESKDNRLFAANITEKTWDLPESEFDARAYRADLSGDVVLTSISGGQDISFVIDNVSTADVPLDHDCIPKDETYRYTREGGALIHGGSGKNVKYRFITTELIEDTESYTGSAGGTLTKETWQLYSRPILNSGLTRRCNLYYINSNGNKIDAGIKEIPNGNGVHNYSDGVIEAFFTGYHRDETYRFGVVFYNKSNMPSTVHWIGDITMPSARENGFQTFDANRVVTPVIGQGSVNAGIVTYPLGIQFSINIPSEIADEVTGYEIVRCDRTEQDKRILCQGVISTLTNYGGSSNRMFPKPYLSYSTSHGYRAIAAPNDSYNVTFPLSEYQSDNYFMFVSPEIAVNKEGSQNILSKVQQLSDVYVLYSKIESSVGDTTVTYPKVMCNIDYGHILVNNQTELKQIFIKGDKFNNLNGYQIGAAQGQNEGTIIMDGGGPNKTLLPGFVIGSFYGALLAKYYFKEVRGDWDVPNIANIRDMRYATPTTPFMYGDDSWTQAATAIGDKLYFNWTYDYQRTGVTGDENNVRKEGPHGLCAVYTLEGSDKWGISPIATAHNTHWSNAVVLVNATQNVSQYGGSSYSSRQNSVYMSTGSYKKIETAGSVSIDVFGGDTYLGVFDYAQGMFGYNPAEFSENNRRNKMYSGAFIPVETSVNLSLLSDTQSIKQTFNASTNTANFFLQNDISVIGNIYSQAAPLYQYNDAYSREGNAKMFVPKSMYSIDNNHSDTRVLSSELKTNNEVTDSWTKFKVANYIDVDSRYGPITKLKTFNNNLFFWQSDAFGTLAVNPRSLITDNNMGLLTLGSGGILERYDYIANKNGLKEGHMKSVVASDTTLYWYDWYRNEICGFSGNMESVAKVKGVQTWLHDTKVDFREDPRSVYDKKYNEVLFSLDDKCLLFNEQLGVFTSFITINPSHWVEFTEKYYSFWGTDLFKHNSGDTENLYEDNKKISTFSFVVNDNYPQTKTFDNVEYSGNFTYPTNFKEITFHTKRQNSYKVGTKDIDYREDTYKFAIPRNNVEMNAIEMLANKTYKDRMKGKYILCNYTYDCNDGKTFAVPYISTAYRYSMI